MLEEFAFAWFPFARIPSMLCVELLPRDCLSLLNVTRHVAFPGAIHAATFCALESKSIKREQCKFRLIDSIASCEEHWQIS